MRGQASTSICALVAVFIASAPGFGADRQLTIYRVAPDESGAALVISGRDMCDAPVVALGGRVQVVSAARADVVVIEHPGYAAGNYRLVVSCGPERERTGEFVVTLHARR